MPRLVVHGFTISLDGYEWFWAMVFPLRLHRGTLRTLGAMLGSFLILMGCQSDVDRKVESWNERVAEYGSSEETKAWGLANLDWDTLVIRGDFAECGEWGGHSEVLNIFRKPDHSLAVLFEVDSADCDNPPHFKGKYSSKKEWPLNKEQEGEVVRYIQLLAEHSFLHHCMSNGPESYSVSRKLFGLRIVYIYCGDVWPPFQEFRTKLIPVGQ